MTLLQGLEFSQGDCHAPACQALAGRSLAMTNGVSTLAGYFILGAEASGADVDFSFLSLYHNRSSLDIRQPAPEGMLFGVAYIMSELSFFTANFALHRNFPVC